MKTIILKLGGSVITDKYFLKPKAENKLIFLIAQELALFWKKKGSAKIILLSGVGSFGHPFVFKHKLKDRKVTPFLLGKISRLMQSIQELKNIFLKEFLKAGLPIVPLQTSSLFFQKRGEFCIKDLSLVEKIIKNRGIPFLTGDIIIGEKNKTAIISADDLAVFFAKNFNNSTIIFATNTDGVYKNFPPLNNEKPLQRINRKKLFKLLGNFSFSSFKKHDVTGEMAGKLKKLLSLRKKKVFIFNGRKPFLLRRFLNKEKSEGTLIYL